MSERSLSVYSAIEPFAGGVIGLGIGYTLAPRKYSLKGLISLDKDTFDKIYSEDLVENLSAADREHLQNIKRARADYESSKRTIVDEVKLKARVWQEKFNKVDVPEEMQKELKENKTNLQKAISDNDYINLNKRYRSIKERYVITPDNEGLKVELRKANSALSEARSRISGKIDAYKNSVRSINSEKLFRVKDDPIKYFGVREAYHDFIKSLAKRRTICSNKLFAITTNKQIRRSYEALSEILPKARTKSALVGAALMSSVSALMVAFLDRSVNRNRA